MRPYSEGLGRVSEIRSQQLTRKTSHVVQREGSGKQIHQRLEKCCLLEPETTILKDETPEEQRHTVPGEAISRADVRLTCRSF